MSLTTNPLAPAFIARRRKPGRPNVVTISTRVSGKRVAHRRRRGDAVQPGHLDVEQGDVGPVLAHGRQHLVARPDLGDHLEVGLEAEQRRQRAPHQGLVVGEQQPDRVPVIRRPPAAT